MRPVSIVILIFIAGSLFAQRTMLMSSEKQMLAKAKELYDAKKYGEAIALLQQSFAKDSLNATLTPESRLELERAIELLRINPTMVVEIGGHTDNVGDDAFNMKLSHDRTRSVRDYLVNGGIESERLQAKGYGELNPVATNDTDEGRKSNRRTEFVILDF